MVFKLDRSGATVSNEPSNKDIKEQVRLAICRLVRDALELNDKQNETPQVIADTEKDILEDAELVLDYLRLKVMTDEKL